MTDIVVWVYALEVREQVSAYPFSLLLPFSTFIHFFILRLHNPVYFPPFSPYREAFFWDSIHTVVTLSVRTITDPIGSRTWSIVIAVDCSSWNICNR